MKLLVDLSGCDMRYSSIAVYSLRILRGFVDNGVDGIKVLCNTKILKDVTEICPEYEIIPIEMTRKISPVNAIKGYFRWRKKVRNIDFDVIYLPHPFPPYHCIYHKGRIVTTILDIEGLRAYHGVKLQVFRNVYPFVIRRSDRLTTISAFVKEDVLGEYPFAEKEKIHPVHCSVVVGTPQENAQLTEKYLLYVSSFLKHKNIITLVKAFNLVKDIIPHQLVIIGRINDYWKENVVPFIEEYHLESRIVHIANGVTDDELATWYKHADLFVHPSYMEGFGYPPIEAAILGTPVLTTKETSIPEVTMDLLNYYEPATDERALANQILNVLSQRPSTEKIKEISEIYKKEYNYRKIANELYNELLTVSQ